MSNIPENMVLTQYLQSWLNEIEWNDEIHIQEENQTSHLSSSYKPSEHAYDLFIDIDERKSFISVVIYSSVVVPESRFAELSMLFSHINNRVRIGRFNCLPGRKVQFGATYDVEGCDIGYPLLSNMLNAAATAMDLWASEIGLVVFSNMTATDVLEVVDLQANSANVKPASTQNNNDQILEDQVAEIFANGGSKSSAAELIYNSMNGATRGEVIEVFVKLAKLTPAGASTYYANIKKNNS
jgi:hypothetical protein